MGNVIGLHLQIGLQILADARGAWERRGVVGGWVGGGGVGEEVLGGLRRF